MSLDGIAAGLAVAILATYFILAEFALRAWDSWRARYIGRRGGNRHGR